MDVLGSPSRLGRVLLSALFLALPLLSIPASGLPVPRRETVSIVVDYDGSWKLRYKLYYHEIGDSEVRELSGFGKSVLPVQGDRELVNLCAWLTPNDVDRERERLRVSIVVDDGARRTERESPPSLFGRMSSVCYHF